MFVHAKAAEEKFLKEGHGVKRHPVMYNDFVLVGPKSDPAGIKGMKDVGKALNTIKNKKADFHLARRPFRHQQGRAPALEGGRHRHREGEGPLVQGDRPGHGRDAQHRGGLNAYTLSDRATWIHFKNKHDLVIVVEGDKRLFNQYGVLLVNPKRNART